MGQKPKGILKQFDEKVNLADNLVQLMNLLVNYSGAKQY
jgi:hypothetical protein